MVTAQCICPGFVTDAARAMQGSIHRLVDADLVLERLRKAKDVACMVTIKKNAAASPVRCGLDLYFLSTAVVCDGCSEC